MDGTTSGLHCTVRYVCLLLTYSMLVIVIVIAVEKLHALAYRDVREWFSVSPIPPIPARYFPFPFPIFTRLKNHSHSRIPPDDSFPFPPIPIPASTFRLIVGYN